MHNRKVFLTGIFVLFLISVNQVFPGSRLKISLNENWKFISVGSVTNISLSPVLGWERIRLPHTWNKSDAMDDVPGYDRQKCFYKCSVNIPAEYKDKQLTLAFEGANQEVVLYVNEKLAGEHKGGYTGFSFDITKFVNFDNQNEILLQIDNSFNKNIPPLSADFTFFGGIYRDVFLLVTEKIQISTTHYGSEGIFISTPEVNTQQATVEIKTLLQNHTGSKSKIRVNHYLVNPQNIRHLVSSKYLKIEKETSELPDIQIFKVEKPQLWSPDDPCLYSVITQLYDATSGQLLDEVSQPLGFRWFSFDPNDGFYLNGKPLKLIGTNRHQCFSGLGNALPDEIHMRDIKLLKDMGANFLRISHYPQDPVIMEMCDKLGILTSVEIPIVNAITESDEFSENSLKMAREMVLQDFNHPSVIIWAYMNEVLLRQEFKNDSTRNATYFQNVRNLAVTIQKQLKTDDPGRYTMIPMHGNFNDYYNSGLTEIPDIIGWNLYQGWYSGTFDKMDDFVDMSHRMLPRKPIFITEFGADVDSRLHSFFPQRFDYTQEYANLYHEHYIISILSKKFIAGATIWNLNDFHSEERQNAVPHVNNKGITTLNRELKDTYYYYQAMFMKKPVVEFGGQLWKIRSGIADKNGVCVQKLKIYSNLPRVDLFQNGKLIKREQVEGNIAEVDVPFIDGNNILLAQGSSADGRINSSYLKIDFRMIPEKFDSVNFPSNGMHMLLGTDRYFEDKISSVVWIPGQEYKPGSWGFLRGQRYQKTTRYGLQPASDIDIVNTENDPVFQTMLKNIRQFRADVPDGNYTLTLYFCELESPDKINNSIYNLGADALTNNTIQRKFDVLINGLKVIDNLDIAGQYGAFNPVEKKVNIIVSENKGIIVDFIPETGEPILNAISIYRNY